MKMLSSPIGNPFQVWVVTASLLFAPMTWANLEENFIVDTDSYKASHWAQYPEGTQSTFSYLESRGGKYDRTVFFGLQYFLKKYLSKPITLPMVEEAKLLFEAHGEPFNYAGWRYIAEELKGK